MLQKGSYAPRNALCVCGSGIKFKKCCGQPPSSNRYHDYGEDAIRWVVVDDTGIKLFADVEGRALVFTDREAAYAIARLDEFSEQQPGEINVAGIGPTKWQTLQEKIAFREVSTADEGAALVRAVLQAAQPPAEIAPAAE